MPRRRVIVTVGACVLALSLANPARAGDEQILPKREEACGQDPVLECLNAHYSDVQSSTVPFALESGSWYPQFGGIFTTMERRRRAAAGEEPALQTLSKEQLQALVAQDPKTAYRLLSADPDARNLFVSLDLLAQVVLKLEPRERPDGYLFMMKIVESTLYASALDSKPDIYAATEIFRNCVQLSLIAGNVDNDRLQCGSKISEQAVQLLESDAIRGQ